MKKSIIFLLAICLSFTACNTVCKDEITKLYFVENYKVHDIGVEVWAKSEVDEGIGLFVEHSNIYSSNENSRVVVIHAKYGNFEVDETNTYLYFSEDDYKEYIKERYDID